MKTIKDVVEDDCEELREIAKWFEERGKQMQGEFLRNVADRYEIVSIAYCKVTLQEPSP